MKILIIRHPKTETEKRELEALSEKAEAFQRTYLRGKRTALVTAPEACCQRTLEVLTARRSGIPFAVTGRTAAEGFRERAGESPKAREARVEREFKGILFRLAAGGEAPAGDTCPLRAREHPPCHPAGFQQGADAPLDPAVGTGIAADLVLYPMPRFLRHPREKCPKGLSPGSGHWCQRHQRRFESGVSTPLSNFTPGFPAPGILLLRPEHILED